MKRKKVVAPTLYSDTLAVPMQPDLNPDDYGIDMIDPDIRPLVSALWELGYRTVCSCCGHLRGLDPYPWIVIDIDPLKEGEKFVKLATLVSKYTLSKGKNGRLPKASEVWSLVPRLPSDKLFFCLMPLNLNPGKNYKTLMSLCEESKVLAKYLLDNF